MVDGGLGPEELRRYGRHLVLPEVGLAGQGRLRQGKVLIIGAGGLGAPVALYLAAAGVGRLALVDDDVVEESNLQRQVLFGVGDLGRPKVEAARDRLIDLNPHIEVEAFAERLVAAHALERLADYDVLVDGSDNFPTRYLVNDAGVLLGKPVVYGAIHRFEGQMGVFWAQRGPCYRCLFDRPPPPELVPNCAEAGVLGVLPGTIGSWQATAVLQLLLGLGEAPIGRLLLYDALTLRVREVQVPRDPDCPVCGAQPRQQGLIDYEEFCGLRRPADAPGAAAGGTDMDFDMEPEELVRALESEEPPLVVDVRTSTERMVASLPAAIHLPMNELAARLEELPRDRDLVVHCHHGGRSTQAVEFLRAQGFDRARNLAGGIDAWSQRIDPSLPRY